MPQADQCFFCTDRGTMVDVAILVGTSSHPLRPAQACPCQPKPTHAHASPGFRPTQANSGPLHSCPAQAQLMPAHASSAKASPGQLQEFAVFRVCKWLDVGRVVHTTGIYADSVFEALPVEQCKSEGVPSECCRDQGGFCCVPEWLQQVDRCVACPCVFLVVHGYRKPATGGRA